MADDDNGEKTEQPTDRRRQEAREQGNIARSADLTAAGLLIGVASLLYFTAGGMVTDLLRYLEGSLEQDAWLRLDRGMLMSHFGNGLILFLRSVLPSMLILLIAAIATNLLQVGFLISTESLTPQWSRINPITGFQRLFSLKGLVRLFGSLLKLTLLGIVAFWYSVGKMPSLLSLHSVDPAVAGISIGQSMIVLAFFLAGTLLALAILDYGYQYWQFEQEIRMTKQEIREEHRQMEGDPQIRQRRREIHRKLASSRQLQDVKGADFVVTNPTHLAVAIKYDAKKMAAPVVVAKGEGFMAERIRTIAAEYRVPIIEKKPLARALYKTVKVGRPIPLDLYEAVAEILAYVYRLRGKKPKAA
jgi:flagellar biosynthetic protein FlhB